MTMRVELSYRKTSATSLSVLLFGLLALLMVACSSEPASTIGEEIAAAPGSSNVAGTPTTPAEEPTAPPDEGAAASPGVPTARALHEAALDDDPAVLQALLDAGADPNAKVDGDDLTPLHYAAAFNQNLAVSQALLDAGADVNAKTYLDVTPLHGAAQHNENPAVLQALLDAGADPDAKGRFGGSPLHWAARHNQNPAVIQALLDAGADPDAKNADGETPLDIAEEGGHPNAVEVLRGAASR